MVPSATKKGLGLVQSLNSARLPGDADSNKRRVPRSISTADIRHPHVNQYTSFEAIDETVGAGRGRAPVATRARKRRGPSGGPALYANQANDCCRGKPAPQMPGHDAVTERQHREEGPELVRRGISKLHLHHNFGDARPLPRSIPHSRTADLEFLNPRPAPPLPRSTTATFAPLPMRVEPPSRSLPPECQYDHELINRKVEAMLSATAALKPELPTQGVKKKPALTTKILSKVDGIFGRHRDKGFRSGSSRSGSPKPGVGEKDSCSTIPSVETELEQGGDAGAGTWKAEHKIPRKRVPNNRLHLRVPFKVNKGALPAPCVVVDPTQATMEGDNTNLCDVESEKRRRPKDFHDVPSRAWVAKYTGSQTQSATFDPFESERSFDNLEALLTTQPTGSSTPRRIGPVRMKNNADGSPLPDRSRLLGHHSHLSSNDADDELTDGGIKTALSRKERGKRPAKSILRLQRGSANVVQDVDDTETKRIKKHPTPSKVSLEELSRDFRALVPNAYEQDGLAMHPVGRSPTTATISRAVYTPPISQPPQHAPPDKDEGKHRQTRQPPPQRTALGSVDYHAFICANTQPSSTVQTPAQEVPIDVAPLTWRRHFSRRVR